MRISLCLLVGILAASSVANAEMRLKARAEGFQSPESAAYDEQSGLVFVSDMGKGGDAVAKDGKGTVSVLKGDGTVVEKDWIKGLNSPKGVYPHLGRFLLVAEKDSIFVAQFQLQVGGSPIIVSSYRLPIVATDSAKRIRRAQLLNDITVNTGEVFVTDTFGNRIYRVTGMFGRQAAAGLPPSEVQVEEFLSGLHLLSPNGITYSAGKLWVVGTDTFTGLGNFLVPFNVTTDRRENLLVQADPERAIPALHPFVRPGAQRVGQPPNMTREQLVEEIARGAADPFDSPNIIDPEKPPRFVGDPSARMINIANSFQKPHNGKLYSVDVRTKVITVYPEPTGGFDGVAIAQEGPGPTTALFVGNFGAGTISSVTTRQVGPAEVRQALSVLPAKDCAIPNFCGNPADFSINLRERLLYVPNLTGGEVQVWAME